MPALVTNVKVKCPGCKSPVPLSAEAVRELSAHLAIQVKCQNCGRERSVSALRSNPPVGPAVRPQALKAAAPFRPLLAAEAEAESKSTPQAKPVAQLPVGSEVVAAPFAALETSPLAVPFAPLEGAGSNRSLTRPAAPTRSLSAWWRELPVARRQLLISAVALAMASVLLTGVLKLRRAATPQVDATPSVVEPAPGSGAHPVEVPPTVSPPREPTREEPAKESPPAAKPNPFRPDMP